MVVSQPKDTACRTGDEYATTIVDGIAKATAGDRVLVCPGVYAESITIGKAIAVRSVEGPEQTVIAPTHSYTPVSIIASGATLGGYEPAAGDEDPRLFGFTLRTAFYPDHTSSRTPLDISSAGVDIQGFARSNGQPAATDATIAGNSVTAFHEVGISVGPGAHRAKVLHNTVMRAPIPRPLLLHETPAITVNLTDGPTPTDDVVIDANTVSAPPEPGPADTSLGIAVYQRASAPGHEPIVTDNTIRGRFGTGIAVHPAGAAPAAGAGARVSGNSIVGPGSGVGISLATVSDTIVTDNEVQGVDRGIELKADVTDAEVHDNRLSLGGTLESSPLALHPFKKQPVDPSANGVDIRDPSTGGIYALDKQNLIYDNECTRTPVADKEASAICRLVAPPDIAGLKLENGPDSFVRGIEQSVGAVHSDGAITQLRLAIDKLGLEVEDYGDAAFVSSERVRFDTLGSAEAPHLITVQARSSTSGAFSLPVTFPVQVRENEIPQPRAAPARLSLHEDLAGDGADANLIELSGLQPQREATEAVTLRVDTRGLAHGTLTGIASDGTVTDPERRVRYIPHSNASTPPARPDVFELVACDSFNKSCSEPLPVEIGVAAVNDAPVAQSASLRTREGVTGSVQLRATDAEGDPLSYSLARAPRGGVVSIAGTVARYVPKPGFSGTDSFRFRASDPGDASGEANVAVVVERVSGSGSDGESSGGDSAAGGAGATVTDAITGTVVVTTASGKKVKLQPGTGVPEGAKIDVRRGSVAIEAPARTRGTTKQRVSVSQGSFTLSRRYERGNVVLVLRMVDPVSGSSRAARELRLLVSGRCRCRVISRDATVESSGGNARWLMAQRARGTTVKLSSGRVRVQDRARRCRARSLPLKRSRRATTRRQRFELLVPRNARRGRCF